MIDPENKRLILFHLIVSLTFYVDIFVTSLLIANYNFYLGLDSEKEFLNHRVVYNYIIGIQGIDILLNFFKIQKIDTSKVDDPCVIFKTYISGPFIFDVISILPYNT